MAWHNIVFVDAQSLVRDCAHAQASACSAAGDAPLPQGTSLMVSHYDPEATPDDETLRPIVQRLREAGGSIARIVTTAQDITDAFRVLALLRGKSDESCFCAACRFSSCGHE